MKPQEPKMLDLKGRETKLSGRLLIEHTARSKPTMAELPVPEPTPPPYSSIDPGIEGAVGILQEHNIQTFESCEGGPGHAYPEPTVAFYGTPEAGWRAVAVCIDYGLPVMTLRRVWDMPDPTEPTGPHWELVFRRRIGC
jgi:hypothetical protein